MTQPILNHIKNISTANDQLFNMSNKLEQDLKQLLSRVEASERTVQAMQTKLDLFDPNETKAQKNFATIQELETVITDIKEALEFVLNQTPRNNNDIKDIKIKLEEINKRIDTVETKQDAYDEMAYQTPEPKINKIEIPRLNKDYVLKKIAKK